MRHIPRPICTVLLLVSGGLWTSACLAEETFPFQEGIPSERLMVEKPSSAASATFIGLEAYPAANEPWTPDAILARRQQAIAETGVSFLYLGPSWKELEPEAGTYDFRP